MQDGLTALAGAVVLRYADIARLLLENRATMDFEDEVRRTDRVVCSIYHRSGFDCEILMIVNFKFLKSSSKELQSTTQAYSVQSRQSQSLDWQSSLTVLKYNH